MVVPCAPPPDFIFTWMSECLIQDRALRIFEQENLTGFSALLASAVSKISGARIQVHELEVSGWGGMAPKETGIREVERCAGCGHLLYSRLERPEKLIDIRHWDGSDFFIVWPLPRFRFVTERVVEVCQQYGITGAIFSRNWPIDRNKSTGFAPGRLSHYMSPERAHMLGEPFGIE